SVSDFPHLCGAVQTGGSQTLPVGTKRHTVDIPGMPSQRQYLLVARHVIDLNDVTISCSQPGAVTAESDVISVQVENGLTSGYVPDPNRERAGLGGVHSRRREQRAVWAEGHIMQPVHDSYLVLAGGESRLLLAGSRFP